MAERSIESYRTRIHQVIFALVFLAIAATGVKGMMMGARQTTQIFGAAAVLIGATLALDRYYWLFCPLFVTFGLRIPGLPFDSMEIGCLAVFAVKIIRVALHADPPIRLHVHVLIALPLFLWMGTIWAVNPVGLNMLGSGTIGGRFYFKLVLAFLVLITLSNVRIGLRECKPLLWTLLGSVGLSAALTLFKPTLSSEVMTSGPEPVTHYKYLCVLPLYFLLFARYSLREILRSSWKLLVAALCGAMVVYSGKRSASATLLLLPFFRVFLSRRQARLTFATAAAGFLLLSVAVSLDGHHGIRLPNSPKRALALVFPKYRSNRGMEGFNDTFRATLRKEARAIIREHPLVGRGGFRMDREETLWIHSRRSAFGGHIMAGAWHSAVYSYAADFGLPCLFLWLVFFVYALVLSVRFARRLPPGTTAATCVYYFTFFLLRNTVFAYTSGHSSMSTLELCYLYGMFLALWNGLEGVRFPDSDYIDNPALEDRL